MKIKQLLKGIVGIDIRGSKEIELTGLSNDSRIVAPGHLFIAKQGSSLNGADYISQAIESGAAAIVTDLYDPFVKLPQVIAPVPGDLEPLLASRFFAEPSTELYVVGVTGTKGKTTTSYMARHLLEMLKTPCGLMGTVQTILGEERRNSTLTTHNSIHNQKTLREMVLRGCKAAVLEVSSHGLAQGRTNYIAFDCTIFTNLTPDHLDYHPTLEQYAIEKRKLMHQLDQSSKKNKRALVNADSPWSAFMRGQTETWTFGVETQADIKASEVCTEVGSTSFVVEFGGQKAKFTIPLIGKFNVYNALGAIGVGLHRGASLTEIAVCLQTVKPAPGRLESIENDRGISIFVDFAHIGEALENVLKALREIAPKRVICVFGAGGNRDPQRRSGMARAAEKYADVSIITSDNPRNEEPMAICQEILAAFRKTESVTVEVDRRAAIHLGVQCAKPGDVLLIAGKGHEKVQIFAHQTITFDDCAVVKEALQTGGHFCQN